MAKHIITAEILKKFVSGTSGKSTTPITKVGSANLRPALYLPAMTAKTFNPLLKTFADRLKENGKKPKTKINSPFPIRKIAAKLLIV